MSVRRGSRPLEIGLVNLMPDAALAATERQFTRLLRQADIPVTVNLATLAEIPRGDAAQRRLAVEYCDLTWLRQRTPDALVISGANVSSPALASQAFWKPLCDFLDWADRRVPSVLCSCLATHAVLQHRWGQVRRPLSGKLWGVFPHRVEADQHPLLRGLPTEVSVPHSRWNEISAEQYAAAGLRVLMAGDTAGVHLATAAADRWVLFQGHPEYDPVSLLKEHKRECVRWLSGARGDRPHPPTGYLDPEGERILQRHLDDCAATRDGRADPATYPESQALGHVLDSWSDSAGRVVANWVRGLG